MADFRIALSNGADGIFTGDAKYYIREGSDVLVVHHGDGDRTTYSPTAWLCVSDKAPTSGSGGQEVISG